MPELLLFLIALLSTALGAMTGIGGGVLIKPTVDALGLLSVAAASFLSGATLIGMSTVSIVKNRKTLFCRESILTVFLGIGAAFGGIGGKQIFNIARSGLDDRITLAVQSAVLILLLALVLIYSLLRDKAPSFHVKSRVASVAAGLILGLLSAFLGVGGGPFNVAILSILFSMEQKRAAANSIVIIFISQVCGLAFNLITGSVPYGQFGWIQLILMVIGGIAGGFIGSAILRRINVKNARRVFEALLCVIILICAYNLVKSIVF